MVYAFTVLFVTLKLAALLHGQELESRAMNGKKIEIKDSPWTVAIVEESTYTLYATGTILSDTWVLTASHFWFDEKGQKIQNKLSPAILYGVSTIEFNDKGKLASIEEIFYPKQYDLPDMLAEFDVSLLKTLNLKLQPGVAEAKAISYKGVLLAPGSTCTLAGFGSTGNDDVDPVTPDSLRMVTLDIMSNEECAKHTRLIPHMLCAGSESAGACGGDVGAALICDGNVYALFSQGMYCVKDKVNMGFYVTIDSVRSFISKATNGLIE